MHVLVASAAGCGGALLAIAIGPFLLSWGVGLAPLALVIACGFALRQDPGSREPRAVALLVGIGGLVFAIVSGGLTLEFLTELASRENAASVLPIALESLDVDEVQAARGLLLPRWGALVLAAPVAVALQRWPRLPEGEADAAGRDNLPA